MYANSLQSKKPNNTFCLMLPIGQRNYLNVEPKEIVVLEGVGNYTLIHLRNGKKLLMSRTLKEYVDQLEKYSFMRIHKSFAINTNYILRYESNKTEGMCVYLKDGPKVSVSRRKRKDFIELLTCK
jgi:two-component system, LytTR family, response regulator